MRSIDEFAAGYWRKLITAMLTRQHKKAYYIFIEALETWHEEQAAQRSDQEVR